MEYNFFSTIIRHLKDIKNNYYFSWAFWRLTKNGPNKTFRSEQLQILNNIVNKNWNIPPDILYWEKTLCRLYTQPNVHQYSTENIKVHKSSINFNPDQTTLSLFFRRAPALPRTTINSPRTHCLSHSQSPSLWRTLHRHKHSSTPTSHCHTQYIYRCTHTPLPACGCGCSEGSDSSEKYRFSWAPYIQSPLTIYLYDASP